MKFYILKDDRPVVCKNTKEWAKWIDANESTVFVETTELGDILVESRFMGYNCSSGDELRTFQTTIFGAKGGEIRFPSQSRAEAAIEHKKALDYVREKLLRQV